MEVQRESSGRENSFGSQCRKRENATTTTTLTPFIVYVITKEYIFPAFVSCVLHNNLQFVS